MSDRSSRIQLQRLAQRSRTFRQPATKAHPIRRADQEELWLVGKALQHDASDLSPTMAATLARSLGNRRFGQLGGVQAQLRRQPRSWQAGNTALDEPLLAEVPVAAPPIPSPFPTIGTAAPEAAPTSKLSPKPEVLGNATGIAAETMDGLRPPVLGAGGNTLMEPALAPESLPQAAEPGLGSTGTAPQATEQAAPASAEPAEVRQAESDVLQAESEAPQETATAREETQAEVGAPPQMAPDERQATSESAPEPRDWVSEAERLAARARELVEQSAAGWGILIARAMGQARETAANLGTSVRELLTSPVRALITSWRALTSPIRSAVQRATERGRQLLDEARRLAGRVVAAVTDMLGRALGRAREQGQALLRQAYAGVVAMVRSARLAAVATVRGLVVSVISAMRLVGQRVRSLLERASSTLVSQIAALRVSARARLDAMLDALGDVPAETRAWLRAHARSYARRKILAVRQRVGNLRNNTVGAMRTALQTARDTARERAESAAATFREVFAGPLAAAREHVPEIVGEVEGGLGDIGALAANAQDTAMAETVATETVFAITESALQAEAEAAGSSM